jgi:hypothetical protein
MLINFKSCSLHTLIVQFFLQSTLHQSNANELECKEIIQKDMQHNFEIQKKNEEWWEDLITQMS